MADTIQATYRIRSKEPDLAAKAIAIGQSIGNPNQRSIHENEEIWRDWAATVEKIRPIAKDRYRVVIDYPVRLFTHGSLTHLLTVVMGGQMDIDMIAECQLEALRLPPAVTDAYGGPKYGVEGLRKKLGVNDRPLIGGIVKPKTGITPEKLADICWQMADGGVDFIKEDEILGHIPFCPLEDRVEAVTRVLESYSVIYAPCISHPAGQLESALKEISARGANGFHFNFWGGIDLFRHMASQTDLVAYYQKSGDRVMTTGGYAIDFSVWCQLIRMAGADITHAGMLGGYHDCGEAEMKLRIKALGAGSPNGRATLPSLSCGAKPEMVEGIVEILGSDVMISAGGSIHGHPQGSRAGAYAFRLAAEGCALLSTEAKAAG
jgi:ribulose 1,5-bisphosphate carboxylase large subunit-like protein